MESSASLLPDRAEVKTMAPSSLKKMSEFQGRKEGNYASLEKSPLARFKNRDLGLTLLPGSQIQRKDEKRSGTAAESSLRRIGSRHVGGSKEWKSFETEIQQKHAAQQTAFPNEAKNPSSSPDPSPDPSPEAAKSSHVTARSHKDQPFSQSPSVKDGSNLILHNINSVAAAPYAEQTLGASEIGSAKSYQHDDHSARAMKRRRLGSRASNEMRDSKVGKGKQVAFGTHYDRSHAYHDQDLSDINAVLSEISRSSIATIGLPFGGTARGLESSKPESHRQITHSPDDAFARSHRSTVLGSEDKTLHGSSSALAALTSKSPAKYHHSEPEKLTVYNQPLKSSKSVSTQHRKHPRLFPDKPADIRTQVLKPRKEVNRSWTSHFPPKAKIPHRANLPASSLLAAPFTPSEDSEDHQYPNPINALLTFTNLHAYANSSRTHLSPSLPSYLSLSKSFIYPLDVCAPEDSFDTAHAGDQRQSARRRSASMPNLSSTYATMNMDSSNPFGPALMPTPPRELPSFPEYSSCSNLLSHYNHVPFGQNVIDPPHGHVDTLVNTDNSFSQNWQFNMNIQRQHEYSLSNRQNIGFTSGLHPPQVLTQPSNHQDMTGLSVSKDKTVAAGGPQYRRRRIEVKDNYSNDEVKSIMFNLVTQAQTLKAENISLHSSNAAMEKDVESFQQGKTDMMQQIQHHERIVAQKDQQIEAMRIKGSSLLLQHKRLWDEHNRLLATIRKENGTGNLSTIVKKILWSHSPNAVGAASQGSEAGVDVSPAYHTNGAQLPVPRQGFEQTPAIFQGYAQPVSVPTYSEANVTNVSSRSMRQQGYAATNHNNAYPSQTASIAPYSEADVTKALSRALSHPGFTSACYDNPNSPQPESIPAYPDANVAKPSRRASVQSRFAAANINNASSPHDGSTGWVPSDQLLDANAGTMTTNGLNHDRPSEQVPMERVTIDLTDDSQPPSSSASRNTSVHQTREQSIQDAHPPSHLSPAQYPPAHYPAGYFAPSHYPSGLSAQNQMSQRQLPLDQDSRGKDLEAMQIQKESIARMAEKPLSWLQGENPFRKGIKSVEQFGLPSSRRPSQSNAEENVSLGQSPEAGSVAPLPETATGRKTKKTVPEKTKVVLDAEAKKERAKGYRKTAAEKKKRERGIAKQLLQDETMSNNAMRAEKQDRRAAKREKRREQARKPSEEVRPREPQKTRDGRLYQEDTGVQQAMHGGSMDQVALDDHDSLFGDDEGNNMEIEGFHGSPDVDSVMYDDSATAEEDMDTAYAAELEALLEADTDAGGTSGVRQDGAFGGATCVPVLAPGGDDGYHDFSSESEESEEE